MQPTPTWSPDLVFGDLGADRGHHAGDLVAGHHRVVRRAPFGFDGVDVGVADAGELDVDRHVVRAGVAAGDGGLGQRLGRRGGGICGNSAHCESLFDMVASLKV